MELHLGGLPGNESPCRIPMSVDLGELDALIDAIPNSGPVVENDGFTIEDVCKLRKIKHSRASVVIAQLIRDGSVRHIGHRLGRNGQKVFEIIETNTIK